MSNQEENQVQNSSPMPEEYSEDPLTECATDCVTDNTADCPDTSNCPETMKFSSPEAGMERLSKIPGNVCAAICAVGIDNTFREFLTCAKLRCDNCKSTMEMLSCERMWTNMVYSMCMDFNRDHFGKNGSQTVPQELTDYMNSVSMLEMLQVFIDISQQNGFNAQKEYDAMNTEGQNQSPNINQRQLDDAQNYCRALKQLYHDFVDLYRHCTGTWKPRRSAQNARMPQQRGQYQNNNQSMQNGYQNRGRNNGKYQSYNSDQSNQSYDQSNQSYGRSRPRNNNQSYDHSNQSYDQSNQSYGQDQSYGRPRQGQQGQRGSQYSQERTTFRQGSYQDQSQQMPEKEKYQTFHRYGSNPEKRNNKYGDRPRTNTSGSNGYGGSNGYDRSSGSNRSQGSRQSQR